MDRAVEISISGEFVYTAYKPSDPFTVAVDLPEVDKGAFAGKITSNRPGISEINVSGTRTPMTTARLEILMDSPAEIEAVKAEGSLLIRMKEAAPSMAAAMREEAETRRPTGPSPEIARAVEEAEEILSPAMRITSVEFDYSDGTLKLVIQGDGAMTADIYTLDDRIVVDVPDVVMAASMPAAVVAPVKSVRYGYHNGAVRMVISLRKAVKFDASTVGDKVVIALPSEAVLEILTAEKPPEEVEEAAPVEEALEEIEGKKYTGKVISLDFQNADIVPIFRFIGDISGYNVVVHPSVGGTVTLKLLNVPWDQALDIILNTYGLAKNIEGNIMTIAPTSVFDKIAREQAQHKRTKEVTAELVLRTIHLEHIDVEDMKKEIDDRKALSPRGTMTVDTKGNDLWVEDTEDVLNMIDRLVKHFDKPMYGKQQIMVEAKVVTVTETVFRNIGVDWSGDYGVQVMGTPIAGTFSVNPPLGRFGATIPNALAGSVVTGSAPYAQLALTLDALETVRDAKTLANPRVLTLNGEEAKIQQGTQIPVSTTTAEGSTTEFINANLSLEVTPTIKPNEIIELTIKVNKDRPTAVGGQTGIDTNSVETMALVKNGDTLVIGGIYSSEVEHTVNGIPVLRSIPILGWLFGKDTKTGATNELLILITPRIIKE
jgi:type IV pilus assembly protein PilQ